MPGRGARENLPAFTVIRHILGQELTARHERYLRARTRLAHLPFHKTLADFDFAAQPSLDERQVRDRATLRFIANGGNVIVLGPPGVGKTHLAVALALEAISQGMGTYFIACHDLVNDLRRAHAENRLERWLRVYVSPRLLLIDGMDYIPFEQVEAQVFFELISKRYDRSAPIILTSNKSYGDWGTTFGDPILAAATLDRRIHCSVTVNIRGESYRLREERRAASCPGKKR